jgi:hypothetical protein
MVDRDVHNRCDTVVETRLWNFMVNVSNTTWLLCVSMAVLCPSTRNKACRQSSRSVHNKMSDLMFFCRNNEDFKMFKFKLWSFITVKSFLARRSSIHESSPVGVLGKSLNFIFAFQNLVQGMGRARVNNGKQQRKKTDVYKRYYIR